MFERVYPVSEMVANNLVLTGYKHPSSFGKWDPVKVGVPLFKIGEAMQKMYCLKAVNAIPIASCTYVVYTLLKQDYTLHSFHSQQFFVVAHRCSVGAY